MCVVCLRIANVQCPCALSTVSVYHVCVLVSCHVPLGFIVEAVKTCVSYHCTYVSVLYERKASGHRVGYFVIIFFGLFITSLFYLYLSRHTYLLTYYLFIFPSFQYARCEL